MERESQVGDLNTTTCPESRRNFHENRYMMISWEAGRSFRGQPRGCSCMIQVSKFWDDLSQKRVYADSVESWKTASRGTAGLVFMAKEGEDGKNGGGWSSLPGNTRKYPGQPGLASGMIHLAKEGQNPAKSFAGFCHGKEGRET